MSTRHFVVAPTSPAASAQVNRPRRALLQTGALVLLLGRQHLAWGASIIAVRIWPAPDYSRVTLESDTALKATQTFIASPPRLAVDIEGVEMNAALRELVAKVRADDPNIAGIRVAPNGADKVRLVIDLKQPIKPQVFTLAPVAAYKHRLVFDLYPTHRSDPLQDLVAERLNEGRRVTPIHVAGAAASTTEPATALSATLNSNPALQAITPSSSNAADPLGDLIARQAPIAPPVPTTTAAAPPQPSASTRRRPEATPIPDQSITDLLANRSTPASDKTDGKSSGKTVLSGTDRLIIIALDPGHGGEDPGAIGPGGTREKDVVLQIAMRLRERINATTWRGNPMRAYLTRDADFFVPLRTRVQKAQKVQADLFISLHADAFTNQQARGASVFALSQGGASSETARWMANQENKADLVGGINLGADDPHLKRALLDMSTTAQIRDSMTLGGAMIRQIGQVGNLHKGSVEQAGFAVLKAPDIPSVLVESAFISNPEEEEKLKSEAYQIALADALIKGIEAYFQNNPPLARSRTV